MPTNPQQSHKDFSKTPLARKLSLITAKGSIGEVALLGEPEGFRTLLGELAPSVKLTTTLSPSTKLAICFVRTREELAAVFDMLNAQLAPVVHFWIAYPKTAHHPGFNGDDVREAGLAHGRVDYKICSIDNGWSATKFAPAND